MGVSVRGDLPVRVLCAFPGCFVPTPLNSVTGVHARCCGSAHEMAFLRLDLCPSAVPDSLLIPISVFGPGLGAWASAPSWVLVSLDMSVGDLVGYVFMVFLGCAPLERVSPPLGVSLPRGASFQLRLMPGTSVVPDLDSYLLYPPTSGIDASPHLRCSGQGVTLREVGVGPYSLFSLSRLPFVSPLLLPVGAPEVVPLAATAEAASPILALPGAAGGSSDPPALGSTDGYPTDSPLTSGASGLTHVGESGSSASVRGESPRSQTQSIVSLTHLSGASPHP